MTKLSLTLTVLLYLYGLNFATHQQFSHWPLALWPGLVLFVVLTLISLAHRWILKSVLAALLVTTSVAIFFKWQYGVVVTEDIVLSGLINDVGLTAELISGELVGWVLLSGVLPAWLVLRARVSSGRWWKEGLSAALAIALSVGVIGLVFTSLSLQSETKGHIRDPRVAQSLNYFSPVDVLYAYRGALRAKKKLATSYASYEKMSEQYKYSLSPEMEDLTVVLVLGETARGDRFSLNGYAQKTNPQLDKLEGLKSFSNVSSCDTLTIASLRCMMSPMLASNPKREITHSSFTEVFRSLGFSVDIYALQSLSEFYRYLGYDKLISKYAVLSHSDLGAKDAALLPFVEQAIADSSGRELLIVHTLGSHQAYSDRVEDGGEVFEPACKKADVRGCSETELGNAYDNSIVETDKFLSHIIKMLRHKKALLVYISDHGESLGENGVYFHGSPLATAPKEQLTVPWIIWASPAFKDTQAGSEVFSRIEGLEADSPLSHDHLFHSMLGCAGVSSENGGVDESMNICGETFLETLNP